jgi:hypothetical protein
MEKERCSEMVSTKSKPQEEIKIVYTVYHPNAPSTCPTKTTSSRMSMV